MHVYSWHRKVFLYFIWDKMRGVLTHRHTSKHYSFVPVSPPTRSLPFWPNNVCCKSESNLRQQLAQFNIFFLIKIFTFCFKILSFFWYSLLFYLQYIFYFFCLAASSLCCCYFVSIKDFCLCLREYTICKCLREQDQQWWRQSSWTEKSETTQFNNCIHMKNAQNAATHTRRATSNATQNTIQLERYAYK